MAIQTQRETRGKLSDLWNRPIEGLHSLSLNLLNRLNQEQWVNLFTVVSLVAFNLLLLFFLIQGRDNLAVASVILLFTFILAIFVVEAAVVAFIVVGTSLFINVLYYIAPVTGTGMKSTLFGLLAIISARAMYEYLRIPRAERPRLITALTTALILFWVYYSGIVAYHYLYHYQTPNPNDIMTALGSPQYGILRFFDGMQVWIGVIPLIILLRDWRRAKRVLVILGVVMTIGLLGIVLEYFVQLPTLLKIFFAIGASGETDEGYRIRDPNALYFGLIGVFAAIYSLGYLRGTRSALALVYIAIGVLALLMTKNRILWGGMMLITPLAFLLKSPQALWKQLQPLTAGLLLLGALLLHPEIYDSLNRVWREAVERWERNYAFGGDPRFDPSYLDRVRELEAWREYYKTTTPAQKLFGSGLLAPYGIYITIADVLGIDYYEKNPNARYDKIYVQKTTLHFSIYSRLHRIGIIGVVLLYGLMAVFFIRALFVFFTTKHYLLRAGVIGLIGATVAALSFDSLHGDLISRPAFVPIVLLWSILELIPHWQRTGQLEEPIPAQSAPT